MMITIPNELPESPDHVFGLATPQHMLAKLGWEIRQLRETIRNQENDWQSTMIAAYQAFNCAVTAWHCADWAWCFGDDSVREHLSERYALSLAGRSHVSERAKLEEFCNAVVLESRDIHVCRKIANGSKHMKLRNPDPDLRAMFAWSEISSNDGEAKYGFDLYIRDNGEQRPAVEVFRGTFDYWLGLFRALGYVEGGFYVGPDDDEDPGP